jgi:hypothetical protein
MRILLLIALALGQAASMSVPKEEIATAGIQATVYLPDARTGYYRGTRFDWSGVIARLVWNQHEYFGQWFERYDPLLHDAITGPVEEFLTGDSALGYQEARAGETFVRIGVGAVRKPEEAAYRRFATYDIVDPGSRTVTRTTDSVTFVHELRNAAGYSYVYTKTLRLSGDTLVLEHSLKNTGQKAIVTNVYDHNFFTLDRRSTGPDFVVRFPFEPRALKPLGDLAATRGKEFVFLRQFEKEQTVFTELEGFGPTAADYDIRVENGRTGAGVHVTADRPLAKLVFWSAVNTVCPEPYIDASVEPGKESSWRITYQFYQVPPPGP